MLKKTILNDIDEFAIREDAYPEPDLWIRPPECNLDEGFICIGQRWCVRDPVTGKAAWRRFARRHLWIDPLEMSPGLDERFRRWYDQVVIEKYRIPEALNAQGLELARALKREWPHRHIHYYGNGERTDIEIPDGGARPTITISEPVRVSPDDCLLAPPVGYPPGDGVFDFRKGTRCLINEHNMSRDLQRRFHTWGRRVWNERNLEDIPVSLYDEGLALYEALKREFPHISILDYLSDGQDTIWRIIDETAPPPDEKSAKSSDRYTPPPPFCDLRDGQIFVDVSRCYRGPETGRAVWDRLKSSNRWVDNVVMSLDLEERFRDWYDQVVIEKFRVPKGLNKQGLELATALKREWPHRNIYYYGNGERTDIEIPDDEVADGHIAPAITINEPIRISPDDCINFGLLSHSPSGDGIFDFRKSSRMLSKYLDISPELQSRFADWSQKVQKKRCRKRDFPRQIEEEGLELTRALKRELPQRIVKFTFMDESVVTVE